MSDSGHDKTLALGALFQAAGLAMDLARGGQCDAVSERVLLDSVLVLDSDSAATIYPTGEEGLRSGLTWLERCLQEQQGGLPQAAELLRLVLGMIQVERHLRGDAGIRRTLRQRLQNLAQRRQLQPETGSREWSGLFAAAYVDTLGSLPFRIQIRGDARQLQAPGMPERIRAILLAGVRAAWLWQRLGGRRWHLIFNRASILRDIRELAKSV